MTSKSRGYKLVILFVHFLLQDTGLVHQVSILINPETKTDQIRWLLKALSSLFRNVASFFPNTSPSQPLWESCFLSIPLEALPHPFAPILPSNPRLSV